MSDRENLAVLLGAHRNALGHEGIMSDGEVAWLACTCGYKENVELPEDDIRIAEEAWERHIADAVLAAGWVAPTTVQQLRALHRPWYEIDGVRHDHAVMLDPFAVPAGHVCRVGGSDACNPEYDEHYDLACIECRQTTEDGGPAYLLWPCDTIRAVAPSDPATEPGGES